MLNNNLSLATPVFIFCDKTSQVASPRQQRHENGDGIGTIDYPGHPANDHSIDMKYNSKSIKECPQQISVLDIHLLPALLGNNGT